MNPRERKIKVHSLCEVRDFSDVGNVTLKEDGSCHVLVEDSPYMRFECANTVLESDGSKSWKGNRVEQLKIFAVGKVGLGCDLTFQEVAHGAE